MQMLTIPNQSSIPKAFQEFEEAGRMRRSALCGRIVDVMEGRIEPPFMPGDRAGCLVGRRSARKETARAHARQVNLSAAA
ncbi:hypothetical protein [Stagnihabitans tardus]|uniref:hypothetical protein n=1 Tax=Stagnihabitans tardus TaxID=2699202 RepID=UPI001455BB77|nr:hypothetical protein [Stagnihabitans tardus]